MDNEKLVTRRQAASILGVTYQSICRLETAGKLSPRKRKGAVVYTERECIQLAARRALPQLIDPECVLLLAPVVAELGSLGFGDEHGTVTSASLILAARRLRAKVREARTLDTERTTEQS